MNLAPRLIRVVAAAALVGVIVPLVATLGDVLAHRLLTLGFHRSVGILLAEHLGSFLLPAAGLAAVGVLLTLVTSRRGWSGPRLAALVGAAWIVLPLLLHVGYDYNRYRVDVNWSWMREWHGLRVPGFLWETEVLLRNAGMVLGALLLIAGGTWLLARALGWMPVLTRLGERILTPIALGMAVVAGGALLLLAPLLHAADPSRPSFLVICLDTLRADHVGAYGYPLDTSPTLDRIASEGTLFEWTIAQAEATLPSHVSLFTSRLPSSHGVWNHHHELTPDQVTLAEVFRESGYRTAAFVDAGHLLGLFGFTQGFDRYHDRYKRLGGSVDMALDWLDGVGDDDFFLFVHGYDVHAPYAPWSPYRDDFVDPDHASDFEPTVDVLSDICWTHRQDPTTELPLTEAELAYTVACYDAALRSADDEVKRLLDRLDADGRLADTWIVILSDHGEEFGEHGSMQHDKLYLTVSHVPLIVRPPDGDPRWARGHRASGVSSLIDVFPTLVELAGEVSPVALEGRSRVPELRGEASTGEREIAYSQTYQFGHQRALVTPELHVLSSMEAPDSLDILAYPEDPFEQDPTRVWFTDDAVRHDGPFGPAARTLSGHLRQWMQDTAPGMEGREARRLLGSDFETLRNLGYIQ